jgi:hypothetical protein
MFWICHHHQIDQMQDDAAADDLLVVGGRLQECVCGRDDVVSASS